MSFSLLTSEPIKIDVLTQHVRSQRFGGHVTFTGDVRDRDDGQVVTLLHYTAYEEMARKELARIAGEAETRWDISCAVAHRIGTLEVGECSVAVVVGAPHRAEAFEACRWVIDTVKTDVPIWKCEEYESGQQDWIEGGQHVAAQPLKIDDRPSQ